MSPPELSIRPFAPADQEGARGLILEGLGEHFGYIDETCNPDLDDIMSGYMLSGHLFVVAQVGTELAGTGALICGDEQTSQMVRVSVRRAWRRRGIGRRLVEQLVQEARRRGDARLVVETNTDWEDAIYLYECCGFRRYAQDDESVYLELVLNEASD